MDLLRFSFVVNGRSVLTRFFFYGSTLIYPCLLLALFLFPHPPGTSSHQAQILSTPNRYIFVFPGPTPALCCTGWTMLSDVVMRSLCINGQNAAVNHRWPAFSGLQWGSGLQGVSVYCSGKSRHAVLYAQLLLSAGLKKWSYRLRPSHVTGLHVPISKWLPVPPTLHTKPCT